MLSFLSVSVRVFLVQVRLLSVEQEPHGEKLSFWVYFVFPSLVSSWEVLFDPLNELHADFCHIVPSESVLDEFHIDRHLDHFQGSSEDSAQQVGVDERAVVIGQLHKVYQGVILQDEGEFVSCWAPIGHAGGDSEVHLERNLSNDIGCFSEILTPADAGAGQEILNQTHANVITHLVQLFIDLLIILIVFTKLCDQGPVGQREQLRVHLLVVCGSVGLPGHGGQCIRITQVAT